MIESGVSFDYAQLVMDNDIARMIKHVVKGIQVTDDALAVDDIHAVGSAGDFLSLDATMRHMRETSQPALMDRRVREDWAAKGETNLYDRALETARDILSDHHPDPLPKEVAGRLRAIVEDADRRAGAA